MIFSNIPYWIPLIWAIVATAFLYFRQRKGSPLRHWIALILCFAINFFFFAYAIIIFIILEVIRYYSKEKKGE